jgi:tetratricopeptide (TPR) repeat protein
MTETAHVGDGGRKSKGPRLPFVFALVGAVLLAGSAGVIVRRFTSSHDQVTTKTSSARLPTRVEDAQALRLSGDQAAADKKISEGLSDPSSSPEIKSMLYIQQGNAAADKGNYQVAIDAYLKAFAAKKAVDTAKVIGDAYKQLGDKPNAIAYYKKAIPLIPASSPVYDDEKAAIQDKIDALEGKQ